MSSEIEDLLRAALYKPSTPQADAAFAQTNSVSSEARVTDSARSQSSADTVWKDRVAPLLSGYPADPSGLATEVSRLTEATRTAAATNVPPPKTSTSAAAQDTSVAETMIRTAAMMTGVGPIVTGLMKLFGSDEPEALPPLEKFLSPTSVSVEAGLSSTRQYGAIRHAQGGRPELLGQGPTNGAQAATVLVNIQAMDSQSFLDRQDDIARAVREAMLHSSSLNDVVQEL